MYTLIDFLIKTGVIKTPLEGGVLLADGLIKVNGHPASSLNNTLRLYDSVLCDGAILMIEDNTSIYVNKPTETGRHITWVRT